MRNYEVELAKLETRIKRLEQVVEQLAADSGIPIPALEEGPSVEAEAAELLRRGRKIEAVKLYREAAGVGLKEAKEYVDNLQMRIKRGEY